MKTPFSRIRRLAITVIALACAAYLFRAQLASALVIRGDDYLFRGDRTQALKRYSRALAIDPLSDTAADRYAFISLQMATPDALTTALQIANRYLTARPSDATILTDRALCYLHLRDYARAQTDFERAALAANAPADYVFAGWAARRAGHVLAARSLWLRALAIRPGFGPAVVALASRK